MLQMDLWLRQALLNELTPIPLTPVSAARGRRASSSINDSPVLSTEKTEHCVQFKVDILKGILVYHRTYTEKVIQR